MTIEGVVAHGFEPVREAFAANFTDHHELGAAVCVYVEGRPVVDLWGGVADPNTARPWMRDTIALVYSATKGAVATAAHLLVQRGLLDLDAPVARYWPEFAAAGKENIPVRWLLSHQAGLPVLDEPVPLEDALAWQPMIEALQKQTPAWEPGTAHGYHGRTFGWLVGEVIRRISGRTPGRFFCHEIADPLGLDFFIGLPEEQHRRRVARLVHTTPAESVSRAPLDRIPPEFLNIVAAATDPESLLNRAFHVTDPAEIDFNSTQVLRAEIPSSNGVGTARSLARMYASLIGPVEGLRLLEPDILAEAIAEQASGIDRVLLIPDRYACGYLLPTPSLPLSGPSAFGHPGRGGSLAFADPERGLAFAYLTNHILEGVPSDPRATNLIQAVLSELK